MLPPPKTGHEKEQIGIERSSREKRVAVFMRVYLDQHAHEHRYDAKDEQAWHRSLPTLPASNQQSLPIPKRPGRDHDEIDERPRDRHQQANDAQRAYELSDGAAGLADIERACRKVFPTSVRTA